MTPELSNNSLSSVSEFISSLIGLHFKESRWNDLKYGIKSASREFGFSDVEAFINWLPSSTLGRKHIEILASHLTIGETWFFREQDTFRVLEERVLSELITSRYSNQKRLRIWSAGCSTGEEAYSIAILLNKMMADISEWNITILATDINPKFLSKASEGTYTDWPFRGAPSWVRENYFRQKGHGLHEIRPSIKKMVTFSYLNLVEDVYPSLLNHTNAIDIIFCRNVLMYLSPQIANKVIRGLNNSLIKGGWLFLSPTDAIRPLPEDLVPVRCPGTTTYRKEAGRTSQHEEYHGFTQESITQQEIPGHIPAQKTENEQPGTYSKTLSMFEQGQAALIARAYANQGVMDEAMRWCEKAIAGDKLNPAGYHLLAIILYEQGRIEDAVKFLKKAIYLDHNFILAYFMLGNLKLKLGDIKGSKICFKNVLGILSSHNPEDVIEGSDGMTAGRLAEIIDSMSVT